MPVKAEKELSLQGLISVIQEHPEAAGKLRFIGSLENRPTVTSYPNPAAYFGVEWRKMRTLLQKIRPYQGFLTAAAAGFTAFVNIYALQSLLPLLARTFQTDSRSVSLAVSATTLAVALASPFCGWLVSRLSRGAVMRLSVTGLCLTGFLAALSGSLNQLILWRFCQGLFLPLLISGVLSFMSCDFPKNQLGRATSYYVTWTIVGGFAGRWTAGMAAAMFGWRPALLILGIMNALAGAVLLGCTQHQGARIKSKESPNVKSFLATLGEPTLRSVYAIGFCSLFTMVGGFTYVTFYLSQAPFLLGPDDLGNIFCVYLLGMAATPALGNVLPEWGSAKAIRLTAQVAVGGLLLTLVPSLPVVVFGLGLLCVGGFGTQAAASSFIAQIGHQEKATLSPGLKSVAAGLYLSSYYLGGCLGGVVPGFAWEARGWVGCVILLATAQLLIYRLSSKLRP